MISKLHSFAHSLFLTSNVDGRNYKANQKEWKRERDVTKSHASLLHKKKQKSLFIAIQIWRVVKTSYKNRKFLYIKKLIYDLSVIVWCLKNQVSCSVRIFHSYLYSQLKLLAQNVLFFFLNFSFYLFFFFSSQI